MCGVLGICAPDRDVARLAHFGLHALQHRGQESAGIAVSDNGRLTVLRDLGLVAQVFSEENVSGLQGQLAIGHTRYSTTGGVKWVNAQPIVQHGAARTVAVGHNGNLVNASELRDGLDVKLSSTSDTELIAALIANDPQPLGDAVVSTMRRLEGAYSVTALAEGKLLAFRDPHGFRPLVLGRLSDGWVIASETCALDLIGADFVRAGLRRDDPVASEPPEAERPEAVRVAERDERVLGERDDRERAVELRHRVRDGLIERRRVVRDQRGDHLRVGGRPERDPLCRELGP